MIDQLIYFLKFGGIEFLFLFFFFLLFYVLFKLISFVIFSVFKKVQPSKEDIKGVLKGSIFIYLFCFLGLIFVGLFLKKINIGVDPERISFWNNFFMVADKKLFGAYVPFWFQSEENYLKSFFDFLSPFLVSIYSGLSVFVGVVFFAALVKSGKLFFRMMQAFFLVIVVSLPFWWFLPAVSPLDGYLNNILGKEIPIKIQKEISLYQPEKTLKNFITWAGNLTSNVNEDNFFAITCFPSMHVAWAAFILYFGTKIWRPLFLLLFPYFILNLVSAIFTLQHYAVDTLAGIFVAILTIVIINKLNIKEPDCLKRLSEAIKNDLLDLLKVFDQLKFVLRKK